VKYIHLTLKSEGRTSKMTCSAKFKINYNYDNNNLITSVVNVTGDLEDYVTRTSVICTPHKIFGY
jgi:hypothetical protein